MRRCCYHDSSACVVKIFECMHEHNSETKDDIKKDLSVPRQLSCMPSLVVLQSAHNEIFDVLVDEAAHRYVHFVMHYGSASSHRFCKRQNAAKCCLCSDWICNAKPTRDATNVFLLMPSCPRTNFSYSWTLCPQVRALGRSCNAALRNLNYQ